MKHHLITDLSLIHVLPVIPIVNHLENTYVMMESITMEMGRLTAQMWTVMVSNLGHVTQGSLVCVLMEP
ncbi:MAG: hypothetical protein AMS23_00410 [Bacteroides sp. SM1_62]|nr:MAG: hypothetical protein AMS23_00410 [Bacteroides sp. SM1_62]